jgi:phospholipid/cholesterol/gamma-HCH transport system permease protein
MLPVLTIFSDLIGLMGSYVVCVYKLFINPELFYSMVLQSVTPKDILTGLVKTVFFGAIIAIVGCNQGLTVRGGAEGVGRSTTLCVVISFILIIMADGLFTNLFYFIFKF